MLHNINLLLGLANHKHLVEVAPLGAPLSTGATDEDWVLLLGFPLPCFFLGHSSMKWPSCPHLKQHVCPSRHLLWWNLPHLAHVGEKLPPYNTLSWDFIDLALKCCELWPWYSPLFLGANALAVDGAGPYYLWKEEWFTPPFCCPNSLTLSFLISKLLRVSPLLFLTLLHMTINLNISMSPIIIVALPFFLGEWHTPTTNKLFLLLISLTILAHNEIVRWTSTHTHAHWENPSYVWDILLPWPLSILRERNAQRKFLWNRTKSDVVHPHLYPPSTNQTKS